MDCELNVGKVCFDVGIFTLVNGYDREIQENGEHRIGTIAAYPRPNYLSSDHL